MRTKVKGIYRAGKIELAEDPGITGEAMVEVTFLEATPRPDDGTPRMMTSGMLAVAGRHMSTLEDIDDIKYSDSRWERE